jgi:bacterioferritin
MDDQNIAADNMFLNDILALREKARDVMQAPGEGQAGAIALLQTVLSAEIVCVLRYTMISVSEDGLKNDRIGAEFQEQANDERRHMSMAAARIEQLGGTPDFNRAATPIMPAGFLDRVRENLAAERRVIEHYHDLIDYFAPRDPATCAMLQEIVRDEEDHTGDMEDLLISYAN